MTTPADTQLLSAEELVAALADRLEAVDRVLEPERPNIAASAEPAGRVAQLLQIVVERVRHSGSMPEAWLLFTAVHARFPETEELEELVRSFDLEAAHESATRLMSHALREPGEHMGARIRVVSDATVIEVDFSARHDHHAGIQRVVREVIPLWAAAHRIELAAWSHGDDILRELTAREQSRLTHFAEVPPEEVEVEEPRAKDLIVPWRTHVLFPDVPVKQPAAKAAAMARFSGNVVGHVGYDLIPITSAELRPFDETGRIAWFLFALKYAHRVAAVSRSAATEFQGFVDTLPSQGLTGPKVAAVTLPNITPPLEPGSWMRARPAGSDGPGRPVILSTGARDPHKNHRAILHAAERLWAEGLDFELRMIGAPGWDDAAYRAAAQRLHDKSLPLVELGRVSEQQLWDELRSADASVFLSLHEGYGLLVAEALSVHTPVLTTDYGSQAEIAADGGCLLVDPRDDDAITDALRRLVLDADLRDQLRAEAVRRPSRTWAEYADELWRFLVGDNVDGDG